MKFKSNIEIQAGLEDKDGQVGSSGQILASTGSQVDWIDPANIVTSATDVVIECKNTSGVTISKGTPVYQTGNVGATAVIEIAVADASDEDKMAAIGLLQSDLINNAFGYVVVTGELLNITTSPIDGSTPTVGDTIYVKPGGGLTLTKPTGVNFIQNVGLIGKVSGGNAGSITVSSIMRSNDVPTPLYIDHDNQRLGIGEIAPAEKLQVSGGNILVKSSNNGGGDANNNLILFDTDTTASAGQGIGSVQFYGSDASGAGAGIKSEVKVFYANDGDSSIMTFSTSDSTTNNQERMRITPTGNVGIGTTSPWNIGAGYTGLTIDDTTTGFLALRTSGTTKLVLSANGTSYLNGGNVGIGTTSPTQAKLVVNTTSLVASAFGRDGTDGDVVQIYNGLAGTTKVIALGASGNDGTIYSQYGDLLLQPTAGNVGIGTTSPSEKLEVAGNIKIQSALLSNQENTDVDTGTETVANVAIATYTAAFFDFVVKKTTNVRSGTVYACHDGTNVEFTETSTNDLGDTSDVTLSVDISGTNMRLLATVTSDDWSVKSLIRAI